MTPAMWLKILLQKTFKSGRPHRGGASAFRPGSPREATDAGGQVEAGSPPSAVAGATVAEET
jgi:hypothetical protein